MLFLVCAIFKSRLEATRLWMPPWRRAVAKLAQALPHRMLGCCSIAGYKDGFSGCGRVLLSSFYLYVVKRSWIAWIVELHRLSLPLLAKVVKSHVHIHIAHESCICFGRPLYVRRSLAQKPAPELADAFSSSSFR